MATAYTDLNTIHNPATGTSPPASWGDGVRDDFDALYNPPLAHVWNSAAQSIADSTDTVLTFNSEYEDTDTLHSTSVNTGRFTATRAGWYEVRVYFEWVANATGRRRVGIRKNATALVYDTRNAVSSGATAGVLTWLVDLTVFDYVDVVALQASGGALNVAAQTQIVQVSGT